MNWVIVVSLRSKAFTGIRWTTLSSVIRALVQIGQISILARLLLPADFGLIAIVMAIMIFFQIFSDAGVSNAIIHYENITQEQLSSLFWLNMCASACLAILLIALSPMLAYSYQKPVIENLLLFSAAGLVINAFGQQLRVIAQKELRFSQLAKLECSAAISGFISTISLALYGAGIYAIIIGSLVSTTVSSLLAWLILARGWKPLRHMRLDEIRPFTQYGIYMIGNNLVTAFNNQIDILLGMRLLDAQSIGAYSVSKNLSLNVQMMINPIVTNVGLPVMAKAQDSKKALKSVYLQTMRMTASINFPIYIAMYVFSEEIVGIVLGDNWNDAIQLLKILSWWGLLRSIGNPAGSLLYSTGKAKLAFKWNVALLMVIGPVIWVGSLYGAIGIALAVTAFMAAIYIPSWYFLVFPTCGATLHEYSKQLYIPLFLSISAGAAGFLSAGLLDELFFRLIFGMFIGTCVYIALSWFFNKPWLQAISELIFGERINVKYGT